MKDDRLSCPNFNITRHRGSVVGVLVDGTTPRLTSQVEEEEEEEASHEPSPDAFPR